MKAQQRGASAMLKLAERLDWVGNSLSEFRQEAKERFDRMDERLQEHGERLARLETDVVALKTDVAVLKARRNSNGDGKLKFLSYVISALVGAIAALAGVKLPW